MSRPLDSLSHQLKLAWKYLYDFQPEKALELGVQLQNEFDKANLQDEALESRLFQLRGMAHLNMNQRDEALPLIKAALGTNPANAEAWSAWAELAYRSGKYREALDRVKEGLKLSSSPELNHQLQLQRARIGIQTGLIAESEYAHGQLKLEAKDGLPYLQYIFQRTELDRIYGRIDILGNEFNEVLPYSEEEKSGFGQLEKYYLKLLETIWMTRDGMPLRQFQHLNEIRPLIASKWFPAELKAHFFERLIEYGLGFQPSDSITHFTNKAEENYQSAFDAPHLVSLELAMRKAFVLWEAGHFTDLIQLMEKYAGLIETAKIPDHNAYPYIWRLQALAYRRVGNFEKALFLLEKAIRTLERKFPEGHWEISGFYNSLANTYSNIRNQESLKKAIETFQKVIKLDEEQFGKDAPELAYSYHNIGYTWLILEEPKKGLDALNKAYQIAMNAHGSDNLNVARHAYILGEAYLENGEINKAIKLGKEGYRIYLKNAQPSETYRVANAIFLGKAFTDAGIYDSALHYSELAFKGYYPDLEMDKIEELNNPQHFLMYDRENVMALLGNLGDIYVKIKQEDKARKAYKTAINCRDQYEIRSSYGSSGYLRDDEFLLDYASFALNNFALYKKTGKKIFLEEGFAMVDKSKTNTLRYHLQGNRAFKYAGIPDQSLKEGKRLYQLYEDSEKEFLQMKIVGASEKDLIAHEISLKEKKQAYFDWEKEVEISYPRYFQLKYDQHLVYPDEVRDKIKKNETLVLEYFWYENQYLFTYAFDGQTIVQQIDTLDGDFEGEVDSMIQMLSLPGYAENKSFDPEFFQSFTQNSYSMYHRLIGSILDSFDNKPYKRLLIIPDQKLAKLNFDILLTEDREYEHVSYQDLPYLIRDYQIRYEYAASLLEVNEGSESAAQYPYLGMAPLFSSTYRRRLTSEKDLDFFDTRLQYNQKEVSQAYKLLGGQAFKGRQANEKRAKEYLENASILHFATHTLLNDSFPMYTSLVLHEGQDSLEDGFLYAYEIYPRQLKAQLTVLSACETGLGKWKHGEGMMSLARAFKYAGCANIVMSLWQADDQATSEIIAQFFTYLKQGYSKDEALQKAKLYFLDKGNGKQFPHYWATFVLVGNDDGMTFQPGLAAWKDWKILLAAMLILVLGIFFLRRNRRNPAE